MDEQLTGSAAPAAIQNGAKRQRRRPDATSHAASAAERGPALPASPLPADPQLFLNREVSWLEFNGRVLGEARDKRHPLLERVKFVSICHSNLDEFYMVRVSGLQQQVSSGLAEVSADGMTSTQQLSLVRERVKPMLAHAAALFADDLVPELAANGVMIKNYRDLTREQQRAMRQTFENDVFPVLTPLALGPGHPFPHISNLSLNMAVVVRDPQFGERFARMKVPGVIPRLLTCPLPGKPGEDRTLVWIEQVIAANLELLFPGLQVVESHPFRVTRDADLEIREDEASDLLHSVEQSIQRRHFGDVCRLEVCPDMPARLRDLLLEHMLVDPEDVYEVEGPLGLSDILEIYKLDRPDLKDPPLIPSVPPEFADGKLPILDLIAGQDILLHHPYESFGPIIDFVATGTRDADVLAIKQTLYRVGSQSPIVKLLAEARDDDTQVAALVELKARFDEENNIEWARALEDAGVHVVYGLVGLKTHCKVALVVRKERDGGLRRYVHLGTGNYNPGTARVYTDLSFLTVRPDIAADVSELFNRLTGYSRQRRYRKLLVAPVNMRERLLEMIERETNHARRGKQARLILKTNTLTDEPIIRALYEAARCGVQIDLIVRGACCMRPGVPGISETVRVTSIIGRFLEHSRIYYFGNAGNSQIYLGSADLMRRNLDRRVEILFPLENTALKRRVREEILEIYLKDTSHAHRLRADGTYERVRPADGEAPFSSQEWFLNQRSTTSVKE